MSKILSNYVEESALFIDKQYQPQTESLLNYYELYKIVKNLNGSIIKCGINSNESFSYFTFFKKCNHYNPKQPLVAFEKSISIFETTVNSSEEVISVKSNLQIDEDRNILKQKSVDEKIEYVPGSLSKVLPSYLINNPELKIALLIIDLDDYEQTLTTLQYFYPRLVSNGVLIISNYYKKGEENRAVKEFFVNQSVIIRHFAQEKGIYYSIKD